MRDFLLTLLASSLLLPLQGCEPHAAAQGGVEPVSDAVAALPYYKDAAFTPHWYDTPAEVPVDFHAVAPFALTNQQGETVTEADLDGRITVANFFFASCPGICPTTMASMQRVQAAMAEHDDVRLLSFSVTPERDSVAVLQDFATRMNVQADTWHLLTGDRATVYTLGKQSYYADEDLGEPDPEAVAVFTHTESLYLVDGHRRLRGIYNGMNETAVTQLIADVRTLHRETAG